MSAIKSTIQHFWKSKFNKYLVLFLILIGVITFFTISTAIRDKYTKYCKLIGGIILAVLGIVMVFAPHLLR